MITTRMDTLVVAPTIPTPNALCQALSFLSGDGKGDGVGVQYILRYGTPAWAETTSKKQKEVGW